MDFIVTNPEALLWLILMIAALLAEAMTATLFSIWFAVGALAAMAIALIGLPGWFQILIFLAVSGLVLLVTKPLAEKMINAKVIKTNADRVLGAEGIVTETINNLENAGQVRVLGQIWSARSESGELIPTGTRIVVKKIEGVKLFVDASTKQEGKEGN